MTADGTDRPALRGDDPVTEIEAIARERASLYEACADVRIDALGEVDEVVARILQTLAKEP